MCTNLNTNEFNKPLNLSKRKNPQPLSISKPFIRNPSHHSQPGDIYTEDPLLFFYQSLRWSEVKAGESITLYCDCVIPFGSHIAWWRNCSHEHQPSLLIESGNLFTGMFPRFSLVFNSSSNSYDLHITNASVSDEGLYYCAIKERKVHDVHSIISSEYQYGNRSTHLSVLGKKISTFMLLLLVNFKETVDCI
uniref:Ig-like domain-containing protein n=1 Tax=Sinocyclocheilus anshuiensis TaxID=1608454 RepID=A0A671NI76_9TELE